MFFTENNSYFTYSVSSVQWKFSCALYRIWMEDYCNKHATKGYHKSGKIS